MSLFKKKTPRPVETIEVSNKHMKLRAVGFLVFLALALTAFTYGIMAWIRQDPGWRKVETKTTTGETCAPDFIFQYRLGSAATAEYKKVQQIYTDAAEYMYSVFNLEKSALVPGNVFGVNQAPNQEIEVDPYLYRAFELMQEHHSRALFLAPIYAEYENIFQSTEDWMARSFDPASDSSQKAYFDELLGFVTDPSHIDLLLLGNNKVKLLVSEDYLAYAEETGITDFIDFYWMKNAFILDYFYEIFQGEGYVHGFITSVEGFSVSLGDAGEPYSTTIYDRAPDGIYPAAVMQYSGAMHMIAFHDYATQDTMGDYFYITEDGTVYTPYIDEKDGLCKSSVHDLLLCSEEAGCADLLLSACPLYIADAWDEGLAGELSAAYGLVYCKDRKVFHSGGTVLSALYSKEEVSYTDEQFK